MSAGYSGTPLPRKLGIKEGSRLAAISALDGFSATLGPLPGAIEHCSLADGELDVIVCFAVERSELEQRLPALIDALSVAGGLWIAWPKRAARVPTDLGEAVVRELGLATGLVDNKVCAIDETWSSLRFVRRLRDRR